ncbi:hypothetical protein BACUNI_04374 [Bacteroides uniformis ATCC 8492]|uniref:Uncharacterized protein n=1 Tax=Bacteroides uniformis (strain ATCC 8492 / DSM 6597 / CCUG 4942 / CIP 103695 / JCM 5828 / KCTC 5204 / NCTC 13054 / VPI 0061) TaxID=411479 RepID=A0ABC9N534_BACUC|nr:hypothetical protein BACUNI_04374 [Bacteroides uniformis ATCC 8492]
MSKFVFINNRVYFLFSHKKIRSICSIPEIHAFYK